MTATPERSVARRSWRGPLLSVGLAFVAALLVVVVALQTSTTKTPRYSPATALATNPNLDPGTSLSGPAPAFTLTDQFGRSVSLHAFRGHVVILAFNNVQCTTVCPLTTTAMVEAKALLGAAGGGVQLLGINANPAATAVRWVQAYSQVHGMLHQWRFLTGALPALRGAWHAYHVEAAIDAGQIDHTPAVYVIDRGGRLAKLYLTQMAYDSVGQQAQILAREVSSLLPGHPPVTSTRSYEQIPPIGPTTRVTLPRAGGRSIRLGPGTRPQLLVFFATWLTETSDLRGELKALSRYQAMAAARGLPGITAVDEASVEPSRQTLSRFLASQPRLSYPVAIDSSGRVADGYLVQDQPWFVLTSRSGQILWYWDASTQPWPTPTQLAEHVHAALATPPTITLPSARQAPVILAGSPAPLAALHAQASQLLGGDSALAARLRALRGYPVVVNVWASTCYPCRDEFRLFASASLRYGRRVGFLGVDASDEDTPAGARGFLASHQVSYPSYQVATGQLASLGGVIGLPTTFFIDRRGTVRCQTSGVYDVEGALDGDIQRCALAG